MGRKKEKKGGEQYGGFHCTHAAAGAAGWLLAAADGEPCFVQGGRSSPSLSASARSRRGSDLRGVALAYGVTGTAG